MKEKTIEEKRIAVLAELKRLVPTEGVKHTLWGHTHLTRIGGLYVFKPTTLSNARDIHHPTEAYRLHDSNAEETEFFYRLLGLEARDAVEAEREKFNVDFQMLKDQIRQSDDSIRLRDGLLQASESRAAKLVEFAEKVLETMVRWQQEGNVLGQDIFDLEQGAAKALAAHKEGGAQG